MRNKALILIALLLPCTLMGQTDGAALVEAELQRYSEQFVIYGQGHVRELMDYGRAGRTDSIYNNVGGSMYVKHYDAKGMRIVFSPAKQTEIDFSIISRQSDTLVVAILSVDMPWRNSMVYVDRVGSGTDVGRLVHKRLAPATHVAACPPIYVSIDRLGDNLVISNQTWRTLEKDEQDYVLPQLKSDTIDIFDYYHHIQP